jgi:hypothetical protein
VRGKTGDPYPQYCENCSKNIVELEDRQLPCKSDNCTGTWTWTKAAQLAAGVRPEIKESEGTPDEPTAAEASAASAAVVAAAAAIAAGVLPEAIATRKKDKKDKKKRKRVIRPPERRCQDCSDFLKDKKTLELPCKQCGTPIYWPPESQLQTHLGAWAEPGMCGACKRDAMEAARVAERVALRHWHPGPGETPAAAEAPAESPPETPTPADDSASA